MSSQFCCQYFKCLRARISYIKSKLVTIHPNPGPGRDKTEEGKKRRRERRYERREEKRADKAEKERKAKEAEDEKKKKNLKIATWNVQRMSLGTRNKRKAKSVAQFASNQGWNAVLLSEVRAENKGTIWMGEEEERTAIIYTKKAAVMLSGYLLEAWIEGGQLVKTCERSIAVKTNNMVLIATYQPVYRGNNDLEIEQAKEDLKLLTKWANSNEVLIIGGDFNAHIGAGEDRPGICGRFGLRLSNNQGRDLLDWCENNGLCFVNSYFEHRRRGTWFHMVLNRWYELDGFLMRSSQRHKFAKKVYTVGEASISDHKPKLLKIEINNKLKKRKREKKAPRIKWENLKNPEKKIQYRQKINEILEANNDEEDDQNENETTEWDEISKVVMEAAKEVCGLMEKRIENPWMIDKDEEVQALRNRINDAIEARNAVLEERNTDRNQDNERRLEEAKTELKNARKELKRSSKLWETQWWEEIINQCATAAEVGDSGTVYKLLKKLGQRGKTTAPITTSITMEEFRTQFKSISENRFENRPEDIEEVLEEVIDISQTEKATQMRELLEEIPSHEEIRTQMSKMKDPAPGKDGVRLMYILEAGPVILERLVKMIQFMFCNSSDKWEDSLKIGLMIPLHKKGDINIPNNFRGVVLLAMGSRILARVLADRIRIWAENLKLLDEEQAGFRKGRSTADVTQIMVRIQEDTVDLRKRIEASGEEIQDEEKPAARLLDLRKAYPRVNKFAMWKILEKYGMGERCLSAIKNLHEATEYRIKGKEGESEPWIPNRGLREGCPSSPPLFNIYHQVVMRIATRKRKEKAEETNLEMGLTFKWVPGSSFPNEARWEKHNSEAKEVMIDKGLFADDTTKIGKKKELEQGVQITKEVMNSLEERNNDDKEEHLEFGEEEAEKIRMLGCYIGAKEDVQQRLKRAGYAWSKVRPQLMHSKLSKRLQARVVEACVESTMLFDCQTRTWQQQEIKKLQSKVDKMYRYVWSRKTKPPLIQMQEDGVNMNDIRSELGIKTVRNKIEKRTLERIGHIFRMDDERQVKAVTLGWMVDLENYGKRPGKKRKTILYWKKLLKEAGVDILKISSLTADRDEWKGIVRARMRYLDEWDRRGGKKVEEERGPRNQTNIHTDDLTCTWEGCERVFKSRAGLMIHMKRMHETSKQKVLFKCTLCEEEFKQQANLLNHMKICTGLKSSDPTKRKCDKCLGEFKKRSFNKHYRNCTMAEASERPEVQGTIYVAARVDCDHCGRNVSASNLSRHKRTQACGAAVP